MIKQDTTARVIMITTTNPDIYYLTFSLLNLFNYATVAVNVNATFALANAVFIDSY